MNDVLSCWLGFRVRALGPRSRVLGLRLRLMCAEWFGMSVIGGKFDKNICGGEGDDVREMHCFSVVVRFGYCTGFNDI